MLSASGAISSGSRRAAPGSCHGRLPNMRAGSPRRMSTTTRGTTSNTISFCRSYPMWIITNPPFRLAVQFAERALDIARHGLALLVRSVWAEGCDRYRRLFSTRPPTVIAQFVERVPMTKARWDPEADTATSYAWFVWALQDECNETWFMWIPPGCRTRPTKPNDAASIWREARSQTKIYRPDGFSRRTEITVGYLASAAGRRLQTSDRDRGPGRDWQSSAKSSEPTVRRHQRVPLGPR
jgi:hypothetical protein